jgi:hypothetical protein
MHRQPTPNSIAAAEVKLGETSPEVLNAVETAMARALEADDVGDQNACEQALADVKQILGSAGTQNRRRAALTLGPAPAIRKREDHVYR